MLYTRKYLNHLNKNSAQAALIFAWQSFTASMESMTILYALLTFMLHRLTHKGTSGPPLLSDQELEMNPHDKTFGCW